MNGTASGLTNSGMNRQFYRSSTVVALLSIALLACTEKAKAADQTELDSQIAKLIGELRTAGNWEFESSSTKQLIATSVKACRLFENLVNGWGEC